MSELLTKYPELTQVNPSFEGIGTLDATLRSSQLSLNVTGQDNLVSMYYCTMSCGTLHLDIGEKDVPISDWTIAWTCTFDKEEIPPSSDEFMEVQNQINQPRDFSIGSLFFAFTNDHIINFDLQDRTFNGADLSDDEKTYLSLILCHWYVGQDSKWQDRQKLTVGYALHTDKPDSVNEQAPSFPPTSPKMQTYPYIAPNETTPGEGLGPAGDNNMLLYLQMTKSRPFPDIRLLEYSGNYVSLGINGTIIIDRDIIWDSYLFRTTAPQLLSLFNAYTYAWVSSASIPDILAEQWSIGVGDTSHSADPSFYAWKQSASDLLTWTWTPSHEEQKYHNVLNTDGGWNKLNIDCTTSNKLNAVPGAASINAGGITAVTIKCYMHVQITWQAVITVMATDGGLKFSLNLPTDLTEVFQATADKLQFRGDTAGTDHLDGVKSIYQGLQDQLVNQFRRVSFGEAEKSLEKDLNTLTRFVIPGNASLSYENPIFNTNGDLMIEANY